MIRKTTIELGWTFTNTNWRADPGYLGCSKLECLPAQVPGHVHLDLVRNGVIADPFFGKHELGCQWVDQSEWIYAVEFTADPTPELPHRRLRFAGLDTVCEVRLNGHLVAEHDNMFVPLEVNVDTRLRAGVNRLEVTFLPAVRVGLERKRAYFEREGLPLDLVRFEESAFVRKAPYMYGWDWGPRLVSAGIWQPVTLLEFAGRICDVHVTQEHLPTGDVVVRVTSATEGAGHVVHFWRNAGEHEHHRVADGECLRLASPALWWPAGLGTPSLHELKSIMLPLGAPADGLELCPRLDERLTRVGLRTVALRQELDDWGTSFQMEVNGQPVWCAGANWIPDHSFPSQPSRERVRQQVGRARAMNMNMLRVWGGGVYESEDFYDACDEMGVLVWQDFPYACSYAPDDAPAIAVAEVEAEAAIRRLRNRPSLALWCGNNENLMMFQAKWDDATKHPARCHGERIWETALPRVLAALDPSRPYLPTSPHSPDRAELANSDRCGDQHNWDVWHGQGDWVHYQHSRARFASEYGFASAPSRAAWAEALGTSALASLEVRDPLAMWHDKTKKGYNAFLSLVELHYGPASNLEEWTYHSQLNQRDALCAAVEHYRSSTFCAGSLIWQLNDCWPVQSWSLLDNTGAPKAAAGELARLYSAAVATVNVLRHVGGRIARFVTALDNCHDTFEGALMVLVRDSVTGAIAKSATLPVKLHPGERKTVLELDVSDVQETRAVLWFSFAGYTAHRLLCEPKQLQTASVSWRAWREAEHILLRASGPALDVWVCADSAGSLAAFISFPEAGVAKLETLGSGDNLRVLWLGGSSDVQVLESMPADESGNNPSGN